MRELVLHVLVVAAEPVGVRHLLHAFDLLDLLLVARRQRVDERDLVDHHEAALTAMSTPMLKAIRIAIRTPKSTKAMKIDRMREDRPDLPAQQVAPDQRQEFHATASLDEHALVEMQRPLRAGGRMRIVRHHHDRLAVLAVERLEQVEDLVAGLAIEIARRLVAEQQRRIGDDRARDADALLLAAGELPRIVIHRAREADDAQRHLHALAAVCLRQLRQQQRQLDVARGGQHRQQVVELEDEADVPRRAMRESSPPDILSIRSPATAIDPSVGVSSPPSRFSSVVLPDPDGPISAR